MVALGGGAIGFIAPDFYINSRVRGRKAIMQSELPNVLDLLCVSVEAGLGFDAALVKLSERMEGPLVEEFNLVLHEMRIGESRTSALKSLSERVEVPEVAQFAAPSSRPTSWASRCRASCACSRRTCASSASWQPRRRP